MSEENAKTIANPLPLADIACGGDIFLRMLSLLSEDDQKYVLTYIRYMNDNSIFHIDIKDVKEPKETFEASKDNTKAKKIPDVTREVHPYTKWVEALDGITGLEWAKVQHCIDQRFKHLSSDYEKKTVLSVSDMDLNWYLF